MTKFIIHLEPSGKTVGHIHWAGQRITVGLFRNTDAAWEGIKSACVRHDVSYDNTTPIEDLDGEPVIIEGWNDA